MSNEEGTTEEGGTEESSRGRRLQVERGIFGAFANRLERRPDAVDRPTALYDPASLNPHGPQRQAVGVTELDAALQTSEAMMRARAELEREKHEAQKAALREQRERRLKEIKDSPGLTDNPLVKELLSLYTVVHGHADRTHSEDRPLLVDGATSLFEGYYALLKRVLPEISKHEYGVRSIHTLDLSETNVWEWMGVTPPKRDEYGSTTALQKLWYPIYTYWGYSETNIWDFSHGKPLAITGKLLTSRFPMTDNYATTRAEFLAGVLTSPLFPSWKVEHISKFGGRAKEGEGSTAESIMEDTYKRFCASQHDPYDLVLAKRVGVIGSNYSKWGNKNWETGGFLVTDQKRVKRLVQEAIQYALWLFSESMKPLLETNKRWHTLTKDNLVYTLVGKRPIIIDPTEFYECYSEEDPCDGCSSCGDGDARGMWYGYPVVTLSREGVHSVSFGGITHFSEFGLYSGSLHPHVERKLVSCNVLSLGGERHVIHEDVTHTRLFCLGNANTHIQNLVYPKPQHSKEFVSVLSYSTSNQEIRVANTFYDVAPGKGFPYEGVHAALREAGYYGRLHRPDYLMDVVWDLLYEPDGDNPYIRPTAGFFDDIMEETMASRLKMTTVELNGCSRVEVIEYPATAWPTYKFGAIGYWEIVKDLLTKDEKAREVLQGDLRSVLRDGYTNILIDKEMEWLSDLADGKDPKIPEVMESGGRYYPDMFESRTDNKVYVIKHLFKYINGTIGWDDRVSSVIKLLWHFQSVGGGVAWGDRIINHTHASAAVEVLHTRGYFITAGGDYDMTFESFELQDKMGIFNISDPTRYITPVARPSVLGDYGVFIERSKDCPDWTPFLMDEVTDDRLTGQYNLAYDCGIHTIGQLRHLANTFPDGVESVGQYLKEMLRAFDGELDGNKYKLPYPGQVLPDGLRVFVEELYNDKRLDEYKYWLGLCVQLGSVVCAEFANHGILTIHDLREKLIEKSSGGVTSNGRLWTIAAERAHFSWASAYVGPLGVFRISEIRQLHPRMKAVTFHAVHNLVMDNHGSLALSNSPYLSSRDKRWCYENNEVYLQRIPRFNGQGRRVHLLDIDTYLCSCVMRDLTVLNMCYRVIKLSLIHI